jgi:hypothetical protein
MESRRISAGAPAADHGPQPLLFPCRYPRHAGGSAWRDGCGRRCGSPGRPPVRRDVEPAFWVKIAAGLSGGRGDPRACVRSTANLAIGT